MLDASKLTDLELSLPKAGLTELPNSDETDLEVIDTLYNLSEDEYNQMPDKKECAPEERCPVCGLYLHKQSSLFCGDEVGWIHTSWLCRKCGYMKLYQDGFDIVKIE